MQNLQEDFKRKTPEETIQAAIMLWQLDFKKSGMQKDLIELYHLLNLRGLEEIPEAVPLHPLQELVRLEKERRLITNVQELKRLQRRLVFLAIQEKAS